MKKDSPKIETPDNWSKAVNFIPKKNQIIIYEGVKQDDVYVKPPRIKIGDGIHTVSELPFEPSLSVEYINGEGVLIID